MKVTWGQISKEFTADQLREGVLLPKEFPINPFSEAFARVDEAVAKKQAFETHQIKRVFHGKAGKQDLEAAVKQTEIERAHLVEAIRKARQPVTHTIRVDPI